jgi:hypothetical protein
MLDLFLSMKVPDYLAYERKTVRIESATTLFSRIKARGLQSDGSHRVAIIGNVDLQPVPLHLGVGRAVPIVRVCDAYFHTVRAVLVCLTLRLPPILG